MSDKKIEKLIEASQKGDMEGVISVLGEGLSTREEKLQATLEYACYGEHGNIISYLVGEGVDLEQQDSNGYRALHKAALQNKADSCRILIEQGANPLSTTDDGSTPFHMAAQSDSNEALEQLIASGADFEKANYDGATPLLFAFAFGQLSTSHSLITVGADINHADSKGDSPLMHLLTRLHTLRIKGWQSKIENSKKQYRIARGRFFQTQGKEQKELSLDQQEELAKEEWFPKQQLAYISSHRLCSYLLSLSQWDASSLAVANKQGQYPFSIACNLGDPLFINALVEKGATFRVKDSEGASPLHYVARSGRADGIKAALKLCKNRGVNRGNNYGLTPLHYLADVGSDKAAVTLLLEAGADVGARTTLNFKDYPAGTQAIDVARHWKDVEMESYLS